MGGTYALIVAVARPSTVRIGALGERSLSPGGYAYLGSAFGTGGFSRVARHRRIARGDQDARHWHVDYLLGSDGVSIESVVAVADEDVECATASELGLEGGSGSTPTPIPGFGASDCDCESHLARRKDGVQMRRAVERAFAAARAGE